MKRRDFLAASTASALAMMSSHGRFGMVQSAIAQESPLLYKVNSWTSDNLFLQGVNAPVFQEQEIHSLPVTGTIPADLQGVYIRNGPNPMFQPVSYQYPLEGDGMLHAVYFDRGKVTYRNRWIITRGLVQEMAARRPIPELRFRNYANTNIISHAGKLLALYEIGLPYEISPQLETIGEWDFNGSIENSMTAHPKYDPATEELHFYRYSFFREPYLTYHIANAQGRIIRTQPIDLPQPTMLHDMALTENCAIFCHCPLVFDLQQAANTGNPFIWRSNQPSRIGLIDRRDPNQKPIWIETESFWVWHFVNAFEASGEIKIDFPEYSKMSLENTLDGILKNKSQLQRITINPNTKTLTREILDDRSVDFPAIDHQQIGKPYRYTYLPHMEESVMKQTGIPNCFQELIQYDMIHQTSKTHRFPPGCFIGEAIVVPKSSAATDDHYVMVWVEDTNQRTSNLVILDSANFEQEAIGQIHLPVRVPFGLHGNWFPQTTFEG